MAAVICCDQCLIIDLSLAVSRVFFSICYLELELYLFAYKVHYDMVNLTHVREYTWDQTMSHRLSAHAKIDVFIIAIRMFFSFFFLHFHFSISWRIWKFGSPIIQFPILDFSWLARWIHEVRGNERGTESSQIGNEKSVHIEFRC